MIASPNPSAGSLLRSLPDQLRKELFAAYQEILRNFRERRWEPAGLNGGKLCEVVYSILTGYVAGVLPNKASKPLNMVDACRALEKAPSTFPRSVRIQIPRMLIALYEIRNNRGVGHVGGDVDPNQMDAACVLQMSKWVIAEVIRIFHSVTTEEATRAVEGIVERSLPVVWSVGDNLRVLDPKMSMKERALVLLYHRQAEVSEDDLFRWVEHSNASVFRRDVLRRAHKAKLLEYNHKTKTVEISPVGIRYVEDKLADQVLDGSKRTATRL